MTERTRTHGSLPHNLITREMAKEMFENTERMYRKKTPVKAIRMETRFTIEGRDGIVSGRPGDYIVDATEDGMPLVVSGEIFNTIFYELSPAQIRQEEQKMKKDHVKKTDVVVEGEVTEA